MKEYILELAGECGFDDAWLSGKYSCLVTISSYTDSLPAKRGYAGVSNYYIASNRAYHATRIMVEKLRSMGIDAKHNHNLPARSVAVAKKGFIGKNGFYFHPEFGSAVYIGTVEVNVDADREQNAPRHCLMCGKCVQACPTGALLLGDMSLCVREHILKREIPKEIAPFVVQLYGCERCQTCCPHNSTVRTEPVQFSVQELVRGEHFARLRELVGKNMAKRDNIISQSLCIERNLADTQTVT